MWLNLPLTPKKDHFKLWLHENELKIYIFIYNSSRATLKETFTAKYNGVLSRTPLVRPKSQIFTLKGDDEHPLPFHMSVPPPPRAVRQLSVARSQWAERENKNTKEEEEREREGNFAFTPYVTSSLFLQLICCSCCLNTWNKLAYCCPNSFVSYYKRGTFW